MDAIAVIHVCPVVLAAHNRFAPCIHWSGVVNARYLGDRCPYAHGFAHHAPAGQEAFVYFRMLYGIMELLFYVRVIAVTYVYFVRLQQFGYEADYVWVGDFSGKCLEQPFMGQVVKVFAEVHYKYVAFSPVLPVVLSQVLFQPAPGKGYALAFEACSVVVYKAGAQDRQQDIFTEAMLHNGFFGQHGAYVACMPSFVILEGLAKLFFPRPFPKLFLHGTCLLEQVQAILLCAAFPAAGLPGFAVARYEAVCLGHLVQEFHLASPVPRL